RGGHQRDGTDDPIRELTLLSCGDIASRENAGRQCTSPCPRKTPRSSLRARGSCNGLRGLIRAATSEPTGALTRSVLAQNFHRRWFDRICLSISSIAAQRPPDAYNSRNLKTGREREARSIYSSSQGRSFQRSYKAGRFSGPHATRTFSAFCTYAAHDLSLRIFRDARSAAR